MLFDDRPHGRIDGQLGKCAEHPTLVLLQPLCAVRSGEKLPKVVGPVAVSKPVGYQTTASPDRPQATNSSR